MSLFLKEPISGMWWSSKEPDQKFYGSLKIKEDGSAILRIQHNRNYPLPKQPNVILGVARANKITLFNCFPTSDPNTGIYNDELEIYYGESAYRVETVLFNIHVPLLENLSLLEIEVGIKELNDWLLISGFTHQFFDTDKKLTKYMDYTQPSSIILNDEEERTISIDFYTRWTLEEGRINSLARGIEQSVSLSIKFKTGQSLEYITKLLEKIRFFFTFALLREVTITEIVVPYDGIAGWSGEKPIRTPDVAEIYLGPPLQNAYKHEINRDENRPMQEPLFYYRNVQAKIKDVFTQWLNQNYKIYVLNVLYLSQFNNTKLTIEYNLFNIVQVLEGLHRHTANQEDKNLMQKKQQAWEELFTQINNGLDKEQKAILRRHTNKFGFEPTLPERLHIVLKKFSNAIEIKPKKKNEFVNALVEYRNLFAHAIEPIEHDWKYLHPIKQVAEIYLKYYLLSLIGINYNDIETYNILPQNLDRGVNEWIKPKKKS